MPCRNPVNIDTCPYCDYHVGSEFKKVQSKRGQFAESKLHSAFRQQGGKGQSGVCSSKRSASRAARARQGVSVQLHVLLHLFLRLQLQQESMPSHVVDGCFATSTTRLWFRTMRPPDVPMAACRLKLMSNAVHWPCPPVFRLAQPLHGASSSAACPVLQQVLLHAHALRPHCGLQEPNWAPNARG